MTFEQEGHYVDDEIQAPRVLEAPAAIWLNYGDIPFDGTHASLAASDDVTWCDAAQFAADVKYVRSDLAERELAAARQAAQTADGMAECMRMFRADMIAAGIITEAVAPMFMTEAILAVVRKDAAAMVSTTLPPT